MTLVTNGNSPASSKVLKKYQTAAELANETLAFALELLVPEASILEICQRVEERLGKAAEKVYTEEGKIRKGLAFPVCISVNNILCYFSPADQEGDRILKNGDLVKVELGAHVDGFPALVTSTMIVGASKASPAIGEAANIVNAAHLVAEAALRLIKVGKTSDKVATEIRSITNELGYKFVEGMISHSVTKDRLADEKMILVNPSEEQAKLSTTCTFEEHDVFVIDIALSNGDGKVRPYEAVKPTVYKLTGENHSLRLRTSREVIGEVTSKFGQMAFNIRHLQNSARTRMALLESTKNRVTGCYDVLEETTKGSLTARVMFTVILLPSGPLKITDYVYDSEVLSPFTNISLKSQSLLELLKVPINGSKIKN